MRELLYEIGTSLKQNKLRTALTGFAVSWGIFLLITLLGSGNGLMNSFESNSSDYISQSITVEGWLTSKPYAGYKENRRILLDKRDLDYTKGPEWQGVIENVIYATDGKSVTLSLNGNTVRGYMVGQMPEHQEVDKRQMAVGRFINKLDIVEQRKVMVLSLAQAKELSPDSPEAILGQWVNVGSVAYCVVGVYHTDQNDYNRMCPIPYSTYKGIYDRSDKIDGISFNINGYSTIEEHEAFEKEFGDAIRRIHDIAPDDKRALWIDNGYVHNMQSNKARNILSTAMWILGLLTLVSGIAGVSNIMLITVKERTHEFGIRKAIGAKPRNVLSLIIAESVVITAIFGYMGMVLGMLACEVMDHTVAKRGVNVGFETIYMLKNPFVDVDTAIKATLMLIIAGTLAGIVPAWKAARVKPIEALRAE